MPMAKISATYSTTGTSTDTTRPICLRVANSPLSDDQVRSWLNRIQPLDAASSRPM